MWRSTTRPITNVTLENNYVERGIYGYFNVLNSNPTIRNNVQWQEGRKPDTIPERPPSMISRTPAEVRPGEVRPRSTVGSARTS